MTRLRSSRRSLTVVAAVTVVVGLTCLCSLPATCSPIPADWHSVPTYRRPPGRSLPSLHGRSPPPLPPPTDKPISISVPGMSIDLTCPMANAQFCASAADSIRTAATRLVSAVQLATTARVRVSFFSKCVESTCPDTLAATVPSRSLTVWVPDSDLNLDPESNDTSLVPHRATGRLIEYPQLVLRNVAAAQHSQLLANSAALLDPDYDVHMRLSADQHWWFPPPPPPPLYKPTTSTGPAPRIGPNQFDMTMVVLHELVHALGFGGVNLMQAGNGVPMILPIAELRTAKDAQVTAGAGQHQDVVWFRAPSVFESHLTSSDPAAAVATLADLARDITDVVDAAVELPANLDAVNRALGQPAALHAALTLYSLATTPGAVTFSPSSAQTLARPLVIETALSPLSPGSSLAHIAQAKYASSPDFLMTYQIPRGKTLDQLSAALGAGESGLGPCTLDALRALGFKVKGRGDAGDAAARLSDRAYVLDRVVVADMDRTFVPLVPGGGRVDGNGMRNAAGRSAAWTAAGMGVWVVGVVFRFGW